VSTRRHNPEHRQELVKAAENSYTGIKKAHEKLSLINSRDLINAVNRHNLEGERALLEQVHIPLLSLHEPDMNILQFDSSKNDYNAAISDTNSSFAV
jgi:hypothetical protein